MHVISTHIKKTEIDVDKTDWVKNGRPLCKTIKFSTACVEFFDRKQFSEEQNNFSLRFFVM